MKLSDEDFSIKARTLGLGSEVITVPGYYGELVVTGDFTPRWACWFLPMAFFCRIVYELLVGLASATAQESDAEIMCKIQIAQIMTVINWASAPAGGALHGAYPRILFRGSVLCMQIICQQLK